MKQRKKETILVDLTLADDVHQILDPCPAVGEGVHHAILGATQTLALLGYQPEEIAPMVEEWVQAVGTTPYPREIPDALAKVFDCDGDDPRLAEVNFNKAPTWPECNAFESVLLAQRRGTQNEVELFKSSPVPVSSEEPSSEEPLQTPQWLDYLFAGDDLLCIGACRYDTAVKPLAAWRGQLEHARFIVPNVFQSTLMGRCNDNVCLPRRYVLTEMDITPERWVWRMALKSYDADPINVQAGILNHLRSLKILRLASVVWSGNKSMHAYWYANQDEEVNLTFMKEAVCLGADYHGWTACQFARIPNPGKPYFQEILYLDPSR
jgi:hypothetical protein